MSHMPGRRSTSATSALASVASFTVGFPTEAVVWKLDSRVHQVSEFVLGQTDLLVDLLQGGLKLLDVGWRFGTGLAPVDGLGPSRDGVSCFRPVETDDLAVLLNGDFPRSFE